MNRLAKFVVKHSKWSLVVFVAIIAFSSILGFQSFGQLKGGGYDDTSSASAEVSSVLSKTFKSETPEVVIIVDNKLSADDQASVQTGKDFKSELGLIDGVEEVTSYYSLGSPASLRSEDGKAVYFFVNLKNSGYVQASVAKHITEKFDGKYQDAVIHVAGFAAITSEINSTITEDLARAESIAVPLILLLLIFVFGSLVAAGLPMVIAALSIVGTFFFIWVSAQFTDTSIFALNLTTGLGLGLGIDYALLMVNRFREERLGKSSVQEAVIKTVNTAGRTVLFSGLTVALVLASLSFFPQYFLQSFAVAGVAVVLIAVAAALIVMPAMLNLLGDKINKGKLFKGSAKPKESKLWGSIARFVMKRPVAVLVITVLGLGGLMSLSGNIVFGQVDDRILPTSNRVVIASNEIRERFSAREGSPVEIIVKGASTAEITDYTIQLSQLDHITRVQSTAGIAQDGNLDDGYASAFASYSKDGYQRIQAIHDIEPRSTDGLELTRAIRELNIDSHEVQVGGSAAIYTDSQEGIERNLPKVGLWIVITTLVLLFLFTGSVLLPIKAILLNVMSLGATFGLLTWIFVDGNLKELFGNFYVTGTVDTSSIVLIAVVTFGLSMDYELFLLSRIKEQHDKGLGTTESVAVGLQQSGRIITAAALVLAFSFASFATSGVTIMKMLGLGIAFAILLDATVVRALLVPALMRLFGKANWWAPKWLKVIYKKVGLEH